MKLFGQVKVQFSKITTTPLAEAVARYLPSVTVVNGQLMTEGLSGGSFRLVTSQGVFNARRITDDPLPGVSLRRHQRVLQRLPAGIGPQPYRLVDGWLFTPWIDGLTLKGPLPPETLAELLGRLHHHRLFGWRLNLEPLLTYYWQQSDPRRRTISWFRLLKRCLAQKAPHPLRVAPLHMDIHAGNMIQTPEGLRLIDWEYAGDGCPALELAAVLCSTDIDGAALIDHYAAGCQLDNRILMRQVARWLPWIRLLSASWYECRFRQTHNTQFALLADEAWQTLKKESIWVRS